MDGLLQLPQTLQVIAGSWDAAEYALRGEIRRNHPGAFEEVITDLFYGLLAEELRSASKAGRISEAFFYDLQGVFPDIGGGAAEIANGLIADVTMHGRNAERTSGGDLGFLILRPHVYLETELVRVQAYRRGLLCQAKRKKGRGYGPLSKSQRSVLPARLKYLAILGYEFADSEGYELKPFRWQPCQEATVEDIHAWLSSGQFPSPLGSSTIVETLGAGAIGTDDDNTIREAISPAGNRALEIRIHWPRGGPPDCKVRVWVRNENVQQATVLALEEPPRGAARSGVIAPTTDSPKESLQL